MVDWLGFGILDTAYTDTKEVNTPGKANTTEPTELHRELYSLFTV